MMGNVPCQRGLSPLLSPVSSPRIDRVGGLIYRLSNAFPNLNQTKDHQLSWPLYLS